MFNVHLQQFEGPLDLLVFFIQRDELDIYDIPIARITDEFLEYVRALQHVDLDAAGEFVFFASLLISIKARMLLPNPSVDELGETIDPRSELVARLLEYVRFKEAAGTLSALLATRAQQYTRCVTVEETSTVHVLQHLGPGYLARGLRRLLVGVAQPAQHAVQRVLFTVEEQLQVLSGLLTRRTPISFSHYTRKKPRLYVIASLLAVLELVRRGAARVQSGAGHDFMLHPTDEG